ncbi:MAG: GTPase ObgE, partial [Acidimicrobiales bacterium]
AEGKGLGHQFLRHIERARVLVILLSLDPISEHSPSEQERILLGELERYQPDLVERPRLVVGSKCDLSADATPDQIDCDLLLSSANGTGVRDLVDRLAAMVVDARREQVVENHSSDIVIHRPVPEGVEVRRLGQGAWQVVGRSAERAVAFSDLQDEGAQT